MAPVPVFSLQVDVEVGAVTVCSACGIGVPGPDGRCAECVRHNWTAADFGKPDGRASYLRLVGDEKSTRADNLSDLLNQVEKFTRDYVATTEANYIVITLWVAHTWAIEAAEVTPFLAVTSPEKRSGKTRLFEVLELLVARPWRVVQPSEAVLFRKLDTDHPTLLLDEADAIFGKDGSEPLRALLNAGNRRGTTVPRVQKNGSKMELVEFHVFGARALAGIGRLPDTVSDRCVPIRMQRRAPGEDVARFRYAEAAARAKSTTSGLEAWSGEAVEDLRTARPDLPDIDDRSQDGWEPLLAIADLAGGEWPARARRAAVALHAAAEDESLGVLLLHHISETFGDEDRMPTADILSALVNREDGPWAAWWGEAVEAGRTKGPGARLAKILRPFGIRSKKIRIPDGTAQGYERVEFEDAWSRYLSPLSHSLEDGTDGTDGTPQVAPSRDVPSVPSVPSSEERGEDPQPTLEAATKSIAATFDAVPLEDDPEAYLVRRYREGAPTTQVGRELRAHGYPGPGDGAAWAAATVEEALRRRGVIQ